MSVSPSRISVAIVAFTVEATWLAAAGVWPIVPIFCGGIGVLGFLLGASNARRVRR